jgi:hypothetical protein
MKALAFVVAACMPALAFAQVGVSVNIGDPGFFGAININGGEPPPPVVYEQPVVAAPVVGIAPPPPIYLRVHPGYERRWGYYCQFYNACGRPVFFVRDDWYMNAYAPRWRHDHPDWNRREYGDRHYYEHRDFHDRDHGNDRGHDHDHDHYR